MLFRTNSSSGVPVYLQLIEQVKHAVDVGALRPGDQLPAIRRVAEDLVINPNTVAKAYRDLEHEASSSSGKAQARSSPRTVAPGASHGSRGRGRCSRPPWISLAAAGLTVDEIRRLVEAELLRLADKPRTRK